MRGAGRTPWEYGCGAVAGLTAAGVGKPCRESAPVRNYPLLPSRSSAKK